MNNNFYDLGQHHYLLMQETFSTFTKIHKEFLNIQKSFQGFEHFKIQCTMEGMYYLWGEVNFHYLNELVQYHQSVSVSRKASITLRDVNEQTKKENKAHSSKIQELKHELMNARSNNKVQTDDLQLGFDMSSSEYSKVIETLESEMERLRSRIQQSEEEKIITIKNNVALKKQLSTLENHLQQTSQEVHMIKLASEEKDKNLMDLKNSFSALNSKFLEQSEDLRTLLAQTEILHKNKSELTKILSSVKGRLEEAELRVHDSVKLTEAAVMEKDAALLREKHTLTEVKRLEKAVSILMDEAGLKAKVEVTKLKDEFNLNIKRLSEDLMKAELSINDKQLQFERSIRDLKKAEGHASTLENKYEKACKEHESKEGMLNQRINSLENRIARLQSEKESTSAANIETSQDFNQQQEELFLRINELEGRLLKVRSDYESLKVSSEEAYRERDYLAEKINHEKELNDSKGNSLQRQVRQKTQEVSELSSMFQSQLEALEETHSSTMKQLYETIGTAQDSCSRLQQQIEDQKEMYDQRISDLNRKFEESRRRSEENRKESHEALKKALVAEDLTNQYKMRIKEVEDRLHATEQRFASFKRAKTMSASLGHLQRI
ncbi:unnamed protein product, partial [Meganyctiphanes norvegica]